MTIIKCNLFLMLIIVLFFNLFLGKIAQNNNKLYSKSIKNKDRNSNSKTNKTWVVFGDSLTEHNKRAKYHYFDYVAKELNLTIINLGISGTGYKRDVSKKKLSFVKRIEQQIKNIDFDIFTIFGSFNDLGKGYELGTPTDSTDETICGCINLTLDIFRKVKPNKKIAIITPTIWRDGVYYGNFEVSRRDLESYVSSLIIISRSKKIPVLDLFHYSGLDPNIDDMLINFYCENGIQDRGVHPNSLGHKFMSRLWKGFIKKEFLKESDEDGYEKEL